MKRYICSRLLLLPATLFLILLVTFVIINLAPGEPTSLIGRTSGGEVVGRDKGAFVEVEDRYVQFRHAFGLDLPLLYNDWPHTQKRYIVKQLHRIQERAGNASAYSKLRLELSDRARFCLPVFLSIADDRQLTMQTRKLAFHFFLRGRCNLAILGQSLQMSKKMRINESLQITYFYKKWQRMSQRMRSFLMNSYVL